MPTTRPLALVAAVATLGATAVALAPAAAADPAIAGSYNDLPVTRMVNTTTGTGAPKAALAPGQTLSFDGTTGITGSVAALDLTVTAIAPAANGFLTAYSGTTRPGVATLTFTRGESTPNDAAVTADSSGVVKIYNGSTGTVQLAVDRNGYWTGGTPDGTQIGSYHPIAPTRVADSRTTKTPLAAGSQAAVPLTALTLPSDAVGVLANVGAVAPTGNGYLTAYSGDVQDQRAAATPAPGTTTVSFTRGRSRTNFEILTLNSTDSSIAVYNGAKVPADYTVDVVGYYTAPDNGNITANGTAGLDGQRQLDSRSATGGGPIAAKGAREVTFDAPPQLISSLIVNVTATAGTSAGFLTAWDGTATRPNSSLTNYSAGVSRTGTLTVPVNADGNISLYNGGTAPVSFTIDLVGIVFAGGSNDNLRKVDIGKLTARMKAAANRR